VPPRRVRTRTCVCFVLPLVAVFLFGCGSSRESTSSSPGKGEDLRKYESDFHPSDIDREPSSQQKTPAETSGTEGLPVAAGDTPVSVEQIDGFRVQMYSTPSIDEAKEKKEEVEGLFPGEWFYMEYDAPTYKIRGGNFLTRFDADRFARQLVEKGFSDSWAVPSRVFKSPGVRHAKPGPPAPK
jgi:hypothetical protein